MNSDVSEPQHEGALAAAVLIAFVLDVAAAAIVAGLWLLVAGAG